MERSTRPAAIPPRGELQTANSGINALVSLAVGVVIIAVLYFGRDVLIPLALAALLSFALAPLVRFLRRRGINRALAVVAVVFAAFSFIAGFWTVVAFQLVGLAEQLPRYQQNLETKIENYKQYQSGEGVFSRASEMFSELREKFGAPNLPEIEAQRDRASDNAARMPPSLDASRPAGANEGQRAPVPVEIRQPAPEPLETLQTVIGPMVEPLATGGIVIVFVVLMLIQREDLRNRVIRLAGASDMHRTTEALDDAAQRVGRYLLMQLVINTMYAIPIGIGLWLIGVPNPLLWAMFALILRFIPYIGAIVSSAFPLILAVAVDPGWSMLAWTAALFITLEIVMSNFVEPWLYGASTGLSAIAVILAAIFWTWLWGPIGLLLATPLTVCLIVLGRHVPQLDFLNVLLGSEPALSSEERLYERLLAGDPAEASERAEEFLEKETLQDFYQQVALPTLLLAERDRLRGVLDDEHRALVGQGMRSIVDDLDTHEDVEPEPIETEDGDVLDAPDLPERATLGTGWHGVPVLCMSGRGELDEAAAAMLAQLVQRRGIGARAAPHEDSRSSNLFQLNTEGVKLIVVSYLNADSLAHARFLVRRLRRKAPDAIVMVAFWSFRAAELGGDSDPVKATGADMLAVSLAQAVERIADQASGDDAMEGPQAAELENKTLEVAQGAA